MIKLKDLLMEIKSDNVAYHFTKLSNLDSIKRDGLKPSIPSDMTTEEEGVYLFKTKEGAEEAFENWYGERYDEDVEFVLLTVDISNLRVFSTLADYEYVSYEPIPPSNIINVELI